jgi:hypothetical protein
VASWLSTANIVRPIRCSTQSRQAGNLPQQGVLQVWDSDSHSDVNRRRVVEAAGRTC